MDRRMLINAAHSEEIRIAIIEGSDLSELEIESNIGKKLKGNIYKAKISRIEPSLQAAFIDIGTQRNGFLQINDVHPSYFSGEPPKGRSRPNIQDVLSPGQELIVQVVKEERDLKGATLTTFLSLPGRYVVLMPGSERGGISRKISDSEQRLRLRKLARELEMPDGMGMIVRTAGLDRSQSELTRDLSLQLKLWEQILRDAQSAPCPTPLYEENDVATRVIRDYFTPEVREIIIDNESTYHRVKQFVEQVMPRYRSRVRLYEKKEPLFSSYGIDEQVASTFEPEVKLKGGGVIVIDPLEALVAIDVNSGKATGGENIEETAYLTNLEAADEVARQLRLRDLGGLIVIDFIDMIDRKHRDAIERRLEQAVRNDKARVELGRLSKFGLMEMSRQRLRAPLSSASSIQCPNCRGSGRIRNHELVALEALRKIQAAVIVGHVKVVKARLSPGPALFLLNNKKGELVALEKDYGTEIYILADGRLRPDDLQFEMESATDHKPVEPAPRTPASSDKARASDASSEPSDAKDKRKRRGGGAVRGKRTRVRRRQSDDQSDSTESGQASANPNRNDEDGQQEATSTSETAAQRESA